RGSHLLLGVDPRGLVERRGLGRRGAVFTSGGAVFTSGGAVFTSGGAVFASGAIGRAGLHRRGCLGRLGLLLSLLHRSPPALGPACSVRRRPRPRPDRHPSSPSSPPH